MAGMRGVVVPAVIVSACLAFASPAAAVTWGERETIYPAIGGDAEANARLDQLPSGKLVGVNDDFRSWVNSHSATMGKLAGGGLDAVRRTLSWTAHEWRRTSEDSSQWFESRSFYDAAIARGMVPIFVITGAPHWATTGCQSPNMSGGDGQLVPPCNKPPADTPEMNAAWRDFVVKAAGRFPAAVFEIWNEPNTTGFWDTANGPDPQRWAELVSLAVDGLRSAGSTVRVIGCACAGLTPGTFPDGRTDPIGADHVHGKEIAPDEFMRLAYAAPTSIRGKLDGISFHFYPQSLNPYAPLTFGAGSHLAELVQRLRAVADAAGEPGKPLWITEAGYWTHDTSGLQHTVTEAQKADGLAALARMLATTPDLQALLIHRGIDGPIGNGSRDHARQSSFGILHRGDSNAQPPLAAKPAYCRLAAMSGIYNPGDPACPALAAPDSLIRSAPAVNGAPPDVRFELAASPPTGALFECALDGAEMKRCGPSVPYELLPDGNHVFIVRAYRLDGTQDGTPAVHRFSVSAAANAPRTRIDRAPRRKIKARAARFRFSSRLAGASFECSLNSRPFKACVSPHSVSRLAPRRHTFRVRAYRVRAAPGPAAVHRFTVKPKRQAAARKGKSRRG